MDVSMLSEGEVASFSSDEAVLSDSSVRHATRRLKANLKKEKLKELRRQKNEITPDDFFSKQLEFQTWLQEKGFNSDDVQNKSKKIFQKFIKLWNSRQLPKKYYRGIDNILGNAKTPSDKRFLRTKAFNNSESVHGTITESSGSNYQSHVASLQDSSNKLEFSTFGKKSLDHKNWNLRRKNSETLSINSRNSYSSVVCQQMTNLSSHNSNLIIGSRLSQAWLNSQSDISQCSEDISRDSSLSSFDTPWSSVESLNKSHGLLSGQQPSDFPSSAQLSQSSLISSSSINSRLCTKNTLNARRKNEELPYYSDHKRKQLNLNDNQNENIKTASLKRKKTLRSFSKSKQMLLKKVSSFIHSESKSKSKNSVQQGELNKNLKAAQLQIAQETPRIVLERYMDGMEETCM